MLYNVFEKNSIYPTESESYTKACWINIYSRRFNTLSLLLF